MRRGDRNGAGAGPRGSLRAGNEAVAIGIAEIGPDLHLDGGSGGGMTAASRSSQVGARTRARPQVDRTS